MMRDGGDGDADAAAGGRLVAVMVVGGSSGWMMNIPCFNVMCVVCVLNAVNDGVCPCRLEALFEWQPLPCTQSSSDDS